MRRRAGVTMGKIDAWHIILAGIILLAAALRLAGIGSGLPVLLYNDESYLVQNATHINWQDLSPHLFVWGSLPFYVVRLVTAAAGLVVPTVTGQAPDDFLVSRLFSTLCSLATLPLLFGIGRRMAGRPAGLVAALLFAVSWPMVEVSHYASLEPLATFLVTLSAAGMLRWLDGDSRRRVGAALVTGLAIATKYNAVLLLVPLTLIALTAPRAPAPALDRRRLALYLAALLAGTGALGLLWALRGALLQVVAAWTTSGVLQPVYVQMFDQLLGVALCILAAGWLLLLAALSKRPARARRQALVAVHLLTGAALWVPWLLAVVAFLLVSPFAVLDFPAFAQGAFFDLAQQSLGGLVGFSPDSRSYAAAASDVVRTDYLFYLRWLALSWGLGALGLMLLGLWRLWRTSRRALLPLALMPVLLLLLATLGRNYGLRYLFPVWGLLALLAGIGFAALFADLRARWKSAWPPVALSAVLALVVCWTLVESSVELLQYRFLRPDTRPGAYAWIMQNIPPGAKILRESETTTAVDTPELERMTDRFQTVVAPLPFEKTSLAQWKAQGVAFMVLSDSRRQFYAAHSAQFADVLAEYRRLETEGRLLHAVEPGALLVGPPIYVYALP